MREKIIIIGGGLGGLFTGAFLAHYGRQVILLEKSHIVGGGLQTFKRNGITYETGMHVLGGFQPGGSLYRICKLLGILEELDLVHLPADCKEVLYDIETGETWRIPQGREAYTQFLIQQFPDEERGIRGYVASIYEIASQIDLFNLRHPGQYPDEEAFTTSVGEFLNRFTQNDRLQHLMGILSMLYGGRLNQTPAYVHALITVLFLNGTSMFRHSSQTLADALCRVILANGGEIHTSCAVSHVEVQDRLVQRVITAEGRSWEADVYISSLHPSVTIDICTPGSFPRAYVKRLQSIPNSDSCFKVFYELDGSDAFPVLPSPVYLLARHADFWQLSRYDDQWPAGAALFMSVDEVNLQGHRMLMVVVPMSFDAVRAWSDSTPSTRPPEYRNWKEAHIERVTDLITQQYPLFRDAIVSRFAATPLTFRDWLGAPEGNMYGYSKDASNILISHLPVQTKVQNLLLTGQCVNLHGICGVPLAALQTAEAVLGSHAILDEIKQLFHS